MAFNTQLIMKFMTCSADKAFPLRALPAKHQPPAQVTVFQAAVRVSWSADLCAFYASTDQ